MNSSSIIVLLSLAMLVVVLYKNWMRPVMILMCCVVVFNLAGILTPEESLAGFANKEIAVIVMLLIVAGIIQKTGLIEYIFKKFTKGQLSYRALLARIMFSSGSVSGFVNNTPLVAILMPYITQLGKRKGISPSRLLIPLSYATILGGTLTLIGTSTNLIVNGLATESGLEPLYMFDFTLIGLPLMVIGFIFLLLFGHRLLPERADVIDEFKSHSREYLVETVVPAGSTYIGKMVEKAQLRHLTGLFLVEIVRKDYKIAPVGPSDVIEENDILIFAGATETVADLLKESQDLQLPSASNLNGRDAVEVVEVVVSSNSSLVGKVVNDTDFRGVFDGAIVAIHRDGERISGKLGEITLRAGDLILLITGKDFFTRMRNSRDLYLISKVKEIKRVDKAASALVIGGTFIAILMSTFQLMPLFQSLFLLVVICLLAKIINFAEIRKHVDFDLVLVLAMAIALSKAIINSGLAEVMSSHILGWFAPFGVIGVLAGIYILTTLLTELITNAAAASIVFPVAVVAAHSLGVDPKPFVLAVAFAGSASFATPFGYQTNLMIYGPGGYHFKDFLRVGIPMNLIAFIVTVTMLVFLYGLA